MFILLSMKAKDVLRVLRITRPTLTKYVRNGTIKVSILPNGRYDYDEHSVYGFFNKTMPRGTVIYARVSGPEQKKELDHQIELLKAYCFQNGWRINRVYQDIGGGLSFENRKDLFVMMDEILEHKIRRVIVSHKDRLSRTGFELFAHLFGKFGAEMVVMSDIGSEKLDAREISGDVVSLLHCYSMPFCSKRVKRLVQGIIPSDQT